MGWAVPGWLEGRMVPRLGDLMRKADQIAPNAL